MKKSLLLISSFVMAAMMQAADVNLIVQRVENNGFAGGSTYRVYAQMPSASHTLHIIYGDQVNPLTIHSTTPLYQNQYAGYSAASISNGAIQADPSMKYDSWVTLGYADNVNNDMWDLGVDFTAFDNGGDVNANNGGWFLLPTDEKCSQDANGLVLIAQFTSTGIVTGTMNLQGWTSPNTNWRELGVSFTTNNAYVFGCTNSKASNYNPEATYNDGTCSFNDSPTKPVANLTSGPGSENTWDVFPNPLRDNLINIQFHNIDLKTTSTRIDIIDMTGRLVGSHSISADAVLPGNRVTLSQDIAAGTYKVVMNQNGKQESKTIIVEN